jgi:hypothetical protein
MAEGWNVCKSYTKIKQGKCLDENDPYYKFSSPYRVWQGYKWVKCPLGFFATGYEENYSVNPSYITLKCC